MAQRATVAVAGHGARIHERAAELQRLALRIAEALGVVGILAVELMERRDGTVVVNELAMRPHNTGHWTQDGCVCDQFEQHIRAVAGWLAAQGVKPGDRVAIAMRNYPEWMLIYWACVSSGIALVGMNAWWTSEEMAYALDDSRPKALFVDGERLERLRERPEMAAGMKVIGVRTPAGAARR